MGNGCVGFCTKCGTPRERTAESAPAPGPTFVQQAGQAAQTAQGAIRASLKRPGLAMAVTTPKVQEGMDIVRAVKDGKMSVADGNAKLAGLDNEVGLPGFMDDIAKHFGDLGSAQKA